MTLKELANFFNVPVVLTYDGEVWGFDKVPYLEEWAEDDPYLYWDGYNKKVFMYDGPVEYDGLWEESLTLPDEHIKEGRMTELMKRYEAETGEDPLVKYWPDGGEEQE